VVMQGMAGLMQIPPLLYLDCEAAEVAGGAAFLRGAPCTAVDVTGGLVLISRPDPFQPRRAELARAQAVQEYLGVSRDNPLVLSR